MLTGVEGPSRQLSWLLLEGGAGILQPHFVHPLCRRCRQPCSPGQSSWEPRGAVSVGEWGLAPLRGG